MWTATYQTGKIGIFKVPENIVLVKILKFIMKNFFFFFSMDLDVPIYLYWKGCRDYVDIPFVFSNSVTLFLMDKDSRSG